MRWPWHLISRWCGYGTPTRTWTENAQPSGGGDHRVEYVSVEERNE